MSINTTTREDITEGLQRSIGVEEALKAKAIEQAEINARKAEYEARGGKVHVIPLGYCKMSMEKVGHYYNNKSGKD